MSATSSLSLSWSAQYSVSSIRSHTLPGDKILLPPTALEHLLSASSDLAAKTARNNLPAYDPYNSATFSAYRHAESQYQDQRQQLPYPLTFRLVNPGNGRVVYAGIQEFSAEEGELVLSAFLQGALGLDSTVIHLSPGADLDSVSSSATITVQVRELSKGTYVKLRPLEAGYNPEDWKSLLERHLRANYTTLTNGQVLEVLGGKGVDGNQELFKFVVDGFKPETDGVCIVDTDLEVDIEALDEEQARETLRKIAERISPASGNATGSSAGGAIDIFHAQQGQVLPGQYVDYLLPSWSKSQPLHLELSSADDAEASMDLLVSPFSATQRTRPRLDVHVFADFDDRPRKRIRLDPTNVQMETAESLYITVHSFAPAAVSQVDAEMRAQRPSRFTLRVSHADPDADADPDDEQSTRSPEDIQCKNCRQWVPKATLMLHENFCLRNNLICPQGCGSVFQRRSPALENHWHCPYDFSFGNTELSHAKHDSLFHPAQVLRCGECSTSETFSSIPALAQHKTTICPAKQILCRFCHLEVPQEGDPDVPNTEALLSGLTPHELADGSRTTECHLCSKIVRLRDMETHLKNHDLDRFSRPPPLLCRNLNCGRTLDTCSKSGDTRAGTRMGQGPGNDVGLCSVCFGPLYVSMHDPENKALRRRIERRYLQQLLTGCGRGWCRNQYCKNGRQNLGEDINVTTKDALPMVRPFLDVLAQGRKSVPLHFCVDEGSQKRRILAEMLEAEQGGVLGKAGAYGLDWCCGALEAENGDLDAARSWLKNWAPSKADQEKS